MTTATRLTGAALEDRFVDLIYADEEWMRAEFGAIIATAYPAAPHGPRTWHGEYQPPSRSGRRTVTPSRTLRLMPIPEPDAAASQRSPPQPTR